ncbi:MAG: hypothetical protein H7836_13170 [Magnetococcus sp. YQC-3]
MVENVVKENMEAGVKPKVDPIMVGDIFIWPNVNSRGRYYTFSKKNPKNPNGYDSLFVTETEYCILRGNGGV